MKCPNCNCTNVKYDITEKKRILGKGYYTW